MTPSVEVAGRCGDGQSDRLCLSVLVVTGGQRVGTDQVLPALFLHDSEMHFLLESFFGL